MSMPAQLGTDLQPCPPADLAVPDATLADATLADATLADATPADATVPDSTVRDATVAANLRPTLAKLPPSVDPYVLLVGLDQKLAEELSEFLSSRGYEARVATGLEGELGPAGSQCAMAFCSIAQPGLTQVLEAVTAPVVVVSRLPEVDDWLDAMDAGAADYCAVPLEGRQLDWILESNLGKFRSASVAA